MKTTPVNIMPKSHVETKDGPLKVRVMKRAGNFILHNNVGNDYKPVKGTFAITYERYGRRITDMNDYYTVDQARTMIDVLDWVDREVTPVIKFEINGNTGKSVVINKEFGKALKTAKLYFWECRTIEQYKVFLLGTRDFRDIIQHTKDYEWVNDNLAQYGHPGI